jgi:multimeric flavodoxin WrbA
MRLLGLSCGNPEGSVELLLRVALTAARERGADVAFVRLDALRIPFGDALRADPPPTDDAPWFWEQLVECDGLIVAAPLYAKSVPGALRMLADRLLGPNADAAFVEELLALRRAGREPSVPFRLDERVLKPRVAGFIACGGSLSDQWKGLGLPLMHGMTCSMQFAVVDQVQFAGAGTPQSIVLDEPALARARRLGSNVADEMGKPFSEARYHGPPGLCPVCHLNLVELTPGGARCGTCGASGQLSADGALELTDAGRRESIISMDEKRAHFLEVQETAARHAERRSEIRAGAARVLAESEVPELTPYTIARYQCTFSSPAAACRASASPRAC